MTGDLSFLNDVASGAVLLVLAAWVLCGLGAIPFVIAYRIRTRPDRRLIDGAMNTALRDYRSAANREKETA